MIMSLFESQIVPSCSSNDIKEIETLKNSYELIIKEKEKALQKSKSVINDVVESYSDDLSKLKENFQKSIKDRDVYTDKIATLNSQLTKLQLEKENLSSDNTQLNKSLKSISKDRRNVEKDLKTKNSKLRKSNIFMKTKISNLEKEIKTSRKNVSNISIEMERFKIQNNIIQQKLHATNIALDARNYTLESERENLAEKLKLEYKKKWEAKTESLNNEIEKLSLLLKAMISNEKDLSSVIDYQRKERSEIEIQLADVNAIKDQMENELIWFKNENDELKKMVQILNSEKLNLIESQCNFENQIEKMTSEDRLRAVTLRAKDKTIEKLAASLSEKTGELSKLKADYFAAIHDKEVNALLEKEDKQLSNYLSRIETEHSQNNLPSQLDGLNTTSAAVAPNCSEDFEDLTKENSSGGQACVFTKPSREITLSPHSVDGSIDSIEKIILDKHKRNQDLFSQWLIFSEEVASLRIFFHELIKKLWSLNYRNTRYRDNMERDLEKLKASAAAKSEKFFQHQRKVKAHKVVFFTERITDYLRKQQECKDVILMVEKRLDVNIERCHLRQDPTEFLKNDLAEFTL